MRVCVLGLGPFHVQIKSVLPKAPLTLLTAEAGGPSLSLALASCELLDECSFRVSGDAEVAVVAVELTYRQTCQKMLGAPSCVLPHPHPVSSPPLLHPCLCFQDEDCRVRTIVRV